MDRVHEMWTSGDYTQRQELQKAFFGQGITYNLEKDECRSLETNQFLCEVAHLSSQAAQLSPGDLKNFKVTSDGSC